MRQLTVLCRTATTFTIDKELDEEALEGFLERLVSNGHGLYLCSGGSGEGHALSIAELERVYRTGVRAARGKVQANANIPEQHTPANTLVHAEAAVRAGVDVINLYGPTGWHGYRPTDDEVIAYFDTLLSQIRHPVALAPNPIIGYTIGPRQVAAICDRYRQVVAVNLAGLGADYFLLLKDALRRDVEIYVPFQASLETLTLGATGLLGAEANIVPVTFRTYLDAYARSDFASAAQAYAQLLLFSDYVGRWQSASPRWIKMAMKILALSGAEGGVRAPYIDAGDSELAEFGNGLRELGIAELR